MNIADAVGFVTAQATSDDLDALQSAIKFRRKALEQVLSQTMQIGSTVTLQGLSPKYLNGLRGDITGIAGKRANILLDEASTDSLRWAGRKFVIPAGTERYTLRGVPVVCLRDRTAP